jgi:uncharacterized protein (TIRG00374 family)
MRGSLDAADPLAHWTHSVRRALPRILLGALLGGVALWLAFRGVDAAALWAALGRVNYVWVVLSQLSLVGTVIITTARWRLLFYPDHRQRGWLNLTGSLLVGQMLNILVPARLGEVARVYLAGASEGLSKTRIAGTLVLEKVSDLSIFALSVLLLLVTMTLPDWLRQSSSTLVISSVVAIVGVLLLSVWGRPLLGWLERFSARLPGGWGDRLVRHGHLVLDGLSALRSWRANAAVWGLSALSFISAAGTNYLLFRAFGLPLSFAAALFLLLVLQVGITPPSLPGKLGIFHYLVVLALAFFGVDRTLALSYALVLYVIALLSRVVAGGVWLAWLRWRPAERPAAHPVV